jgi:hypothetical protein
MAKAKKRAAPGIGEPDRVTIIHLKGTSWLRDWLAGASKKTRIPVAAITRLGYELWAKQAGHPAPPERWPSVADDTTGRGPIGPTDNP